jgi:NADH:ubiquinone oxidoreductase subunit 6 (subunit J)
MQILIILALVIFVVAIAVAFLLLVLSGNTTAIDPGVIRGLLIAIVIFIGIIGISLVLRRMQSPEKQKNEKPDEIQERSDKNSESKGL